MKIKKEYKKVIENIFEAKKEFHKEKSKLPIEEKIKILLKLQEISIKANPDKMRGKRVWDI
ncbi:MAG: hypothetical protein ABI840_08895 [bacterium]